MRILILVFLSVPGIFIFSCGVINPDHEVQERKNPIDSVIVEIERYYELPDMKFEVYDYSSGQCNFLIGANGNFLTTDRYSRILYEVDRHTGEFKVLFTAPDHRICLRKVLNSGTLLMFVYNDTSLSEKQLWRSTDLSYTKFENVLNLGDTRPGYSSHGIAQGEDSAILLGEYTAGKADSIRPHENLWRSLDDGRSWIICHSFTRRGFQPPGDIDYIRHIHVVEYDPYSKLFWIGTGDENNDCQVYTTKDGTKLKLIGRGYDKGYSDLDDGQVWRAISFVFRPDCVLWGMDGYYKGNAHIVRYDRIKKDYQLIYTRKELGVFFYSGKVKSSWSDDQEIAFFGNSETPSCIYFTYDFKRIHTAFKFSQQYRTRFIELDEKDRILIYCGGKLEKSGNCEGKIHAAVLKVTPVAK